MKKYSAEQFLVAPSTAALVAFVTIPILRFVTKYWNQNRLRRMRERKQRAEVRALQKVKQNAEQAQTYSSGDARKNIRLMLTALGEPVRRRMIARLAREGTMSLSKLAEPFGITLPSALAQLRILGRAGIVTTSKQGRVRLCIFNRKALRELAESLGSSEVLYSLD